MHDARMNQLRPQHGRCGRDYKSQKQNAPAEYALDRRADCQYSDNVHQQVNDSAVQQRRVDDAQ